MPSDAPDTTMTPDQVEEIRAEIRRISQAEGIPMTRIAREAGVAYGTLSSWIGGTYAGRNDRIADQARKWMAARAEGEATRAIAPEAPAFQPTPTAEAIFSLLSHAQHMPDIVVIAGGAGIGKTTASCAYTRRHPNVFKIVAEPCAGAPRAMLEDFLRVCGVMERNGTALHRASRALVQRLRGTRALLIVDEAQHLTTAAIDQLRTVHDLAEVGIALVGNETVHSRLEGAGRTPEFAQLFSRVGMRLKRPRPKKADVEALIAAWGIEDAEQRKLLHMIALKPGALRGMTKTLRIAHMLAAAERRALTAADIRAGWERLSSDTSLTAEVA